MDGAGIPVERGAVVHETNGTHPKLLDSVAPLCVYLYLASSTLISTSLNTVESALLWTAR